MSTLFSPLSAGRLKLRNRLAVAPMTRVSATADGLATSRMAEYYRSFAQGGFGLVITEGIYTDKAFSQGYLFQPGLADDAQRDAWKPVLNGVHAHGALMVAQLMHAGALSQGNPHASGTRAPSALRPKGQQMVFYRGEGEYPLPQAMSSAEIAQAVQGFVQAALRAQAAGFDGVEIHGANGYLLDQFLTEGVNTREDGYGGDVRGRLRLVCEVVQAVRAAVGADFLVGLRISQGKVNDFTHKWRGGEQEAAVVFATLGALPLDYLHTTEFEAWQPAFGAPSSADAGGGASAGAGADARADAGLSLAALAKRHGRLPVLANGSLHDPQRASTLLNQGDADVVTLGRGALTHADWPQRVQSGAPVEQFDRGLLSPIADLANADRRQAAAATA